MKLLSSIVKKIGDAFSSSDSGIVIAGKKPNNTYAVANLDVNGNIVTTPGTNLAAVDAFARQRMSEPTTLFDSKQISTKQPVFWDDQQVSGGGTSSTYNANQASTTISVTPGVAGKRVRQTFRRFNYQPGKSQLVYLTGVLGNNASASVGIRTFTSGVAVDNKKTQAQWNIDKMDGTGTSGIDLDFSQSQIFFFDYEWLGVGTVAMGIVVDRTPYYIHFFNHANTTNIVYMSTPNLPLRYEVETDAITITKKIGLFDDRNGIFFEQPNCASASLVHICSSVISEGGFQDTGYPFAIDRGLTPLTTLNDTSIYPLLGLRLKSTDLGSAIKILDLSIVCTSTAAFNYFLLVNPTIVGAALVWSGLTNSSVDTMTASTNGTTVTGGTKIFSKVGSQGNTGGVDQGSFNTDFSLGSNIAGTPDEVYLCVQRVTGTTETFYGNINFKDQQ